MASIRKRKNGNGVSWLIEFYLNKSRKTMFLSAKYTEKEALKTLEIVEEAVRSIETGAPLDPRIYAWLMNMSQDLRTRFESAGLIEPEKRLTLNDLFDRYERAEVETMKPTTARNKRQAARVFFSFIGKETIAQDVTHAQALEYAAYLAKTRSEATKAGYIRDVRRVFNWAIERELLETNPFDHVTRGSFKNKSREHFVSREDFETMLKAAKTQEQRVLLSLYRIGGLRRNEAMLVTWNDVDFKRGRFLAHSPKTEHIKGRDSRLIPLFPELRRELEALRKQDNAEPDDYVIQNNRTTVVKIVRRIVVAAGLEPWERLIQNLRSSRAIEIYQKFGVIAESEWIGHSEKTAVDHYLHLLESDFNRAATEG